MVFDSEEALSKYLRNLNPLYGRYAEELWEQEFNTKQLLANASIETLMTKGKITNQAHAEDIKAQAAAATSADATATGLLHLIEGILQKLQQHDDVMERSHGFFMRDVMTLLRFKDRQGARRRSISKAHSGARDQAVCLPAISEMVEEGARSTLYTRSH